MAGAAACGLSFAASTLVATPSGERPIASLKVGDHVLAVDPKTGKTSTQTVQQVFLNHDTDLLNVTLRTTTKSAQRTTSPAVDPAYKQRMAAVASHGSHAPPETTATIPETSTTAAQPGDETIHTTANHPWLSADRGWVVAGSLHLGEPVERADGSTAVVVALTTVHGSAPMWDLTVSNVHDFAVGNGAYVVHNCGNANPAKVGQHIVSDPDPAHLEDVRPDPRSPTYRGMQVSHESLRNMGYTLDRHKDVEVFPVTRPGSGWKRVSFLAHKLFGGFRDNEWSYVYEHWRKPRAPDIENHYWLHGPSGNMFHHHVPLP